NRVLQTKKYARNFGSAQKVRYLGMGLTGAVLVHSVAESATLMGSTLNALLLGLGVGLIDRVPEFASKEVFEEMQSWLHWTRCQAYSNSHLQHATLFIK